MMAHTAHSGCCEKDAAASEWLLRCPAKLSVDADGRGPTDMGTRCRRRRFGWTSPELIRESMHLCTHVDARVDEEKCLERNSSDSSEMQHYDMRHSMERKAHAGGYASLHSTVRQVRRSRRSYCIPSRISHTASENRRQSAGFPFTFPLANRHGQPSLMFCLVLFMLFVTTASAPVTPQWRWDVQMTEPMMSGQITGVAAVPMPHYSCTKDSAKIYAPGAQVVGGYDCTPGEDCEACKRLCSSFDWGGNAQNPEQGACKQEDITGLDHFPAKCMPRLQTLEGEFSPLATWFDHILPQAGGSSNSSAVLTVAVGPDDPRAPKAEFLVKLSYMWAYVDVFGSRTTSYDQKEKKWTWSAYSPGVMGTVEQFTALEAKGSSFEADLKGNDIKKVIYSWSGDPLAKMRSVTLVGTFKQIQAAMKTMTFKPETAAGVNMNSIRIRHFYLSPTTTKIQPWFQIDYRIRACSSDPCGIINGNTIDESDGNPTFQQGVWVVPVNDKPVISDPQNGYVPGCQTTPPCNTQYSIFEDPRGEDYYFGQFWRWEGSSEPMIIKGLSISDDDIDEGCLFDMSSSCKFFEDPVRSYSCGKLDMNARVLIGTIDLNTRDDLGFYDQQASAKGFTSQSRFVSQAIESIVYRVDTPEKVASGKSLVATKNTQFQGAPQEYLFLRLSDQGATGDTGLAQVAQDKDGNEGLKVKITIAAKNNAPTLTTPTDFTVYEDQPLWLKGLDGDDVDAGEVITSPFALQDWLAVKHNQFYLNRLRITTELKGFGNGKGRGLLYLNSDARDLWIVSNASQVFISIRSGYLENYACLARETIFRPGKYVCGAGSVQDRIGTSCRGDWDFKTCSLIARGKVQDGSTNSSVVLAQSKQLLDPLLAQKLDEFKGRTHPEVIPSRWKPSFTLEITDGPARGTVGAIDEYNISFLRANLWSESRQVRGVPPIGSSWAIYMEPQTAKCEYTGTNLQKVCAQGTTPELSRVWQGTCVHGEDEDCKSADKCCCVVADTCSSEGQYRIHLNFTKPEHKRYVSELVEALDNLNKTCGGLPLRNPKYFQSALSKRCDHDDDCMLANFARCEPGKTCKCCGNLTVTCASNEDCEDFGNPFERRQFCGCTAGYDNPKGAPEGTDVYDFTDKICCATVLGEPWQQSPRRCTSDSDCDIVLPGSKCGCAQNYPVCGPYTRGGISNVGFGQPCTWRFPQPQETKPLCDSNIYAYEGTRDAVIFSQLLFFAKSFENNDMEGKGSTRIEFYGSKLFSILALRGLRYLTYNPNYKYYNRLYRLPEEERDPTTFKIDANDFDVLHVTADDMGNSGGSTRDVKRVTKSLPLIVRAINNPPKLSGPKSISVLEDVPYNIINDLTNPLDPKYGINITDPDQLNFGFNDPRMVRGESLGFMVNLTVTHGCLFVNESFLRNGPEYANRAKDRAVVGDSGCALHKSFDIGGCTIRLKDYGQPKAGLHAVKCTNLQCKMAPCYSDIPPLEATHCYGGRACTKMLAFEGRFPDVNRLLANVTYLGDKDFNTGHGKSEKLLVSISDNGIIGDPEIDENGNRKEPPISVYTDSIVIDITVTAVNDPPVIGRLQDASCVDLKDDGTVNLVDTRPEPRLFQINPSVDKIDVNEDTEFTVMPDRLWIADVDAEEAEIRSSYVLPKCAGQCGSVLPLLQGGCCIPQYCGALCDKMNLVSVGAKPSEVLVEFLVDKGKISFFPPATRAHIRGITFMTNMSTIDIKAPKYAIEPCSDQILCARNQSRIWIRARLPKLQLAMKQGFLRYVGKEHQQGRDTLKVWVSDDGYTDPQFNRKLTASETIQIDVIPVNDDPFIIYPGGEGCSCDGSTGKCSCTSVPPLQYTKGIFCRNNWMEYGFTDPWPKGRALECKQQNVSKIPNDLPVYADFPALSNKIVFSDVDINEVPFGNITVTIKIGRANAGSFTIYDIFSTISYYQWVDSEEMLNLQMKGPIRDVNVMMERLFFDAKEDYSGPAPFKIVVTDNNNYGICTPKTNQDPYKCNRAFCNNIFSGAFLENKFVCGTPVGADNSVINFLPGGKIPCSAMKDQSNQCKPGCRGTKEERKKKAECMNNVECNTITVRESGMLSGPWSGPWSCLGCGYYNPATRQVENSDENNPSIPGLTRAEVDVLVGGAAACKFYNCTVCNSASKIQAAPHGTGCGWCPSFCGGQGKCMIEMNGVPLFETCPTVAPFRGYRQCRDPPSQLWVIVGTVVPSALLFLYVVYSIFRLLQRRHGSLVVWVKKKHFDITYHGRKLWLVPPAGASYFRFFFMLSAILIPGLFLSGLMEQPSGPFHFQEEIYLDSLTSMRFELDNCQVRFIPTNNYPAPTSKIDAVKIRFAYLKHPKVLLENEACKPAVRFMLNNKRSPATKYTGFYCNIEILIPDRYVVPTTVIKAIGSNLTTVRAGPMDADTPNFGLEFGANEFVMEGERIIARIDNVTAKHLKYDVRHGSLLATNITYTPFATFNSLTADISVTTTKMTSARFWQKSGNLMCLSAATIFVDSSCQKKCDFVPQGETPAENDWVTTDENGLVTFERFYRRRHLLSKTCEDQVAEKIRIYELRPGGEFGGEDSCLLNSTVPLSEKQCEIKDSAKCRCKPVCDMKNPADLDFNGVKGVAGKCTDDGTCCRVLCGGYSLADLFPFPNSVRCGVCQPANNCAEPQCGQWSAGKLEQQWWFTSAFGQMSLAVIDHSVRTYNPEASKYTATQERLDPSAWHVYKPLGNPSEQVKDPMSTLQIDFSYEDKLVMDDLFHPGGASNPKQEWVWLRTAGPGAPPQSLGDLLWVQKEFYLVIPDYFLQVVSNSMLNPKKAALRARLRPGFCPPVLKASDPKEKRAIEKRIIGIKKLFKRTLEYPKDKPPKRFPTGSGIAWLPTGGKPPSKFVRDPKTNEFAFVRVDRWSGQGPVLRLVVILSSLVFPLLFAAILMGLAVRNYRKFLHELRASKIRRENTLLNIYDQARIEGMKHYDREEKLAIAPEVYVEMTARTSFFYVVDYVMGQVEKQKSPFLEFGIMVFHMFIVAIPAIYPLYVARAYEAAYKDFMCGNVIDKPVCYGKAEPISNALNWSILEYALLCGFELAFYYLKLPCGLVSSIFRTLFYVGFTVFLWIALWLILLNATWIFLGVLISPSLLAPYALGAVCIVFISAYYYSRLMRFRACVTHQVSKRIVIFASKLGEQFPKRVIEAVLEGNVDNALEESNLTQTALVLRSALILVNLVVLYAFEFVGFQAYTEPTDANAAMINCGIVVMTALGVFMTIKGDSDKVWNDEQTQAMCQKVLLSMGRVFQLLQDQMHMASKIIVQQRKELRRQKKVMLGSDYDGSDSEEESGSESGSYSTSSSSYVNSSSGYSSSGSFSTDRSSTGSDMT